MYKKPSVITFTKEQISKMMVVKASTCFSFCSEGATYCGKGSNYSGKCPSTVNYCTGGAFTGAKTSD